MEIDKVTISPMSVLVLISYAPRLYWDWTNDTIREIGTVLFHPLDLPLKSVWFDFQWKKNTNFKARFSSLKQFSSKEVETSFL